MPLLSLIIIIFCTFVIGLAAKGKWRPLSLLIASILAMYWLQPSLPIRHLDFWLPTTSLAITMITWSITRQTHTDGIRPDLVTGIVIIAVVLFIGLTRYLGPVCCLTASRPPSLDQILLAIAVIALLVLLAARFWSGRIAFLFISTIFIIIIFVAIKSEPLAKLLSVGLRTLNSQSIELAASIDIKWLGFSYVAFRLLHTLRDRMTGRLPGLSLGDFVIYIIFFPAFTAGPIDRVQRFTQDLQHPFQLTTDCALNAGKRIFMGIFRKFVLADGLALISMNSINSSLVNSAGWLWLTLYAFAFRIYFDFSGYSDIAIGLGQLLGVQLPENFERPYLKQNITQFWNSWHMTLAQWFRAYFFNPLIRALRSNPRKIPLPLIIFIGQLSTFLLIGLWHGVSWNFAIWGAWHGLGLFVHNRWSELVRSKTLALDSRPVIKNILGIGSIVITFHYVSFGWIWFVLSTPAQSWQIFLKLFGLV